MSLLGFFQRHHHHFAPGGKYSKYYPLYEMVETFLYTPGQVTTGKVHVRDGIDQKRLMITVAFALIPSIFMAAYNTGLQANLGLSTLAPTALAQQSFYQVRWLLQLGFLFDPSSVWSNLVLGFSFFLPVFLVTNIVGGLWETLFAVVRKHEINEGFLVTGMLFPLTLPATIPLWQVALGISFGIVIGKELFGGTSKNFLNPALTARAFLFFAYPAQISGDQVWVAVDGYSGATSLAIAAVQGHGAFTHTWWDAFVGIIPGSMGETSTLAILIGAVFLLLNGIGSWRIMLSVFVSTVVLASIFNLIGSNSNPLFALPPWWHVVLGGWAFGTVFMATDPISASMTLKGQYWYGALIGVMVVLVRVVNPAYPEGMMLAILFANIFAPLIDWLVVQSMIKKRRQLLATRRAIHAGR